MDIVPSKHKTSQGELLLSWIEQQMSPVFSRLLFFTREFFGNPGRIGSGFRTPTPGETPDIQS